ncbi:transmembrane protein 143 [Hydra vulgaris]|uniref:transmembrane protein 143 n=1 Tax=Hydra vulgaris TaxID=6087 RepID=UPI000640DB16|nr:transmembrane protein 143 [Hydra vulgaris]
MFQYFKVQSTLVKNIHIEQLRKTSLRLFSYSKVSFGLNNEKSKEFLEDHKQIAVTKHIPVTKKTLLNKIINERNMQHFKKENMQNGKTEILEFAKHLEYSCLKDSLIGLSELQQLYVSLNPDKESVSEFHVGKKQHLDNEFVLLQKVASLLQMAKFQELTHDQIPYTLGKHPVSEGVLIHIDLNQYDVLRIWILGEEEQSLIHGWRDTMKYFFMNMFKKQPKAISIYNRVVIAVRLKKQNKLLFKSFKDLPQSSIEYVLPEASITMSINDKKLITTFASACGLSILIKLCTIFIDYNAKWTFIVGSVSGLLTLHTWNSYVKKRNQYLNNTSKILYYKTLATNKNILQLITDSAVNEILKSTLLCYIFIQNMKDSKPVSETELGITVQDLELSIESWFFKEFHIQLDFDAQDGLRKLEQLGLLKVTRKGLKTHLDVLTLNQSINTLSKISATTDVNLVDIRSNNLLEIKKLPLDINLYKEKLLQEQTETFSRGWN